MLGKTTCRDVLTTAHREGSSSGEPLAFLGSALSSFVTSVSGATTSKLALGLGVRVRVSMKISLLLILCVFHARDFRTRRNSGAQELILSTLADKSQRDSRRVRVRVSFCVEILFAAQNRCGFAFFVIRGRDCAGTLLPEGRLGLGLG